MSPDYRITPEIYEITRAARGESDNALRRFRRDRDLYRAYQSLFFENGAIEPDAKIVLGDLAEKAGIGMASASLELADLTFLEGKRWLFLHLMGRFKLNATRVENLERQLQNEEEGQ